MIDVGFLHTAEVHVATFDQLANERLLSVQHRVETEWLATAIKSGVSSELRSLVTESFDSLRQRCNVVICTCTTLGDIANDHPDPRVFRVDAPMMQLAAEHKGAVLLAYALDSTRDSSQSLLHQAGTPITEIELLDCTADWSFFEAADMAGFGRAIANRATQRLAQQNLTCVVLAQASMTAAEPFLETCKLPVYSSPATAMDYAARLAAAG